jgi:hypothetical protein
METVAFTSSKDIRLSIFLNEETREHLRRHFGTEQSGSKFNYDSPDELFQEIVNRYPQLVQKAVFNEYGCKTVSITFPFVVGCCNVVPLDELNEEERSTLRVVKRDETLVRCALSSRIFPTHECQLILDADNNIITAYPGELAPPLPDSPDIHDDYWDNHVFIEPIK